MTELPPILLLDVDGVLNALEPAWGDVRKAKCAGLTIRWAPALAARIADLHASGRVEVRWCTTWCGFPKQLAEFGTLLGLHLDSAFTDRPQHLTWADLKVKAALAVLAEGRRLIWVDDCEVGAGRDLFPPLAAAEADGRALLVQPPSRFGLAPTDMASIELFALACIDAAA